MSSETDFWFAGWTHASSIPGRKMVRFEELDSRFVLPIPINTCALHGRDRGSSELKS